jgi:tRNA(Ile)-lysidine synthase
LIEAVRAGLRAARAALTPSPGSMAGSAQEPRLLSVCAGYSGGLDSTVLLHLLTRTSKEEAITLSALHVHHGLSPNAHAWERHCAAACDIWRVPLRVAQVTVNRAPRTSLEEEARRSRHQAFADVDAEVIALAQHADDQAETVLLQLLRGAGPKGLAGMPLLKPMAPGSRISLLRPLLAFTRAQLESYAKAHALAWIEDESNQDDSLKRNFLRNRVMPLLREAFPAPAETFGRSARHQAEAAQLLDALADIDLQAAADGDMLRVQVLLEGDDARLKNALRRWLELASLRQPSEARLAALVRALRESSNDTRLRWEHEGRCVIRVKGWLRLQNAGPAGVESGENAPN